MAFMLFKNDQYTVFFVHKRIFKQQLIFKILSATSPGGQEYLSDDADQVDAVVHQVVQSEHPRRGVHLVLLYHIILEKEKKA